MLIKAYEKDLCEYRSMLASAEAMAEELQLKIAQLYDEMLADTNLMQLPSGTDAADAIFKASQMTSRLYEMLHELDTAVIRTADIYESTEKRLASKMSGVSDKLHTACTALICTMENKDTERIDSIRSEKENRMLEEALGTTPAAVVSTDISMTVADVNRVFVVSAVDPELDEEHMQVSDKNFRHFMNPVATKNLEEEEEQKGRV